MFTEGSTEVCILGVPRVSTQLTQSAQYPFPVTKASSSSSNDSWKKSASISKIGGYAVSKLEVSYILSILTLSLFDFRYGTITKRHPACRN